MDRLRADSCVVTVSRIMLAVNFFSFFILVAEQSSTEQYCYALSKELYYTAVPESTSN